MVKGKQTTAAGNQVVQKALRPHLPTKAVKVVKRPQLRAIKAAIQAVNRDKDSLKRKDKRRKLSVFKPF